MEVGSQGTRTSILALAALVFMLSWVPIVTGLSFPSKMDEFYFHVPNIVRYADHFPSLTEMRETNLSMLPLWHGLMGRLAARIGTEEPILRACMIPIALAALLCFALLGHQLAGIDWRMCTLFLVAFPYFGVTYFVVITDYPAFLAVLVALLGQVWFLRTGRQGALWLAGIAGLVACLIRQNLIYITGIFILALLVGGILRRGPSRHGLGPSTGHPNPHSSRPPLPMWRASFPLLLPFLGLLFQIWLWGGILPPSFMNRPHYYDPTAGTYLLALISVGANVGYYFLPAALALAMHQIRSGKRRAWFLLAILAIGGVFWCFHMRGVDLVNTYGTFRHSLGFLRERVHLGLSLIVLWASILSFLAILYAGLHWVIEQRSNGQAAGLLFCLLLGSLAVVAFGLFRIYERHILPVHAFATLVLLAVAPWGRERLLRLGWLGSIVFGTSHCVLYAITVYELMR